MRKHFLHPPDSLLWALEGQGNQAPVLGEDSGVEFLPVLPTCRSKDMPERAQSSPGAPRRQLQLCRAGRYGAGIHRGRDKVVPVPANSGHSPNRSPPGRAEESTGVTEDLGVTRGGWRGKGREGQEPIDSELDGAGWNANPYQGAWGLSLPIWEMGQRRSIREWTGPGVYHESLGNLDQNHKETLFFPFWDRLQTQQTCKSGQAGKVRALDAPAEV